MAHLNQARSPLGIRNRPNIYGSPRDDDDDDGREDRKRERERKEGEREDEEEESSRSRDISRISYNL